jgi:hypothetical protein
MALPSGPGRLTAGFAALRRLPLPRTLPAVLRRHSGQALTLLLAFALAAALMLRFVGSADAKPRYDVPHDGQIEAVLGVRFSQAAVVADGGLIELRYVVLDTQKASAFQNDTKHPPQLRDERNNKIAWRAALMKQGHELRPGQSYYLLYLNNQGAIKRGDKIAIEAGPRRLAHVPVR